MAPPWSSALTEYARTASPALLPSDVLVAYDEHTLTIQDAYPKAQYHYLVLPRIPWRLTGEEWEEVEKEMNNIKEGPGGHKEGEGEGRGGGGGGAGMPQKQGKQQQLNFAGGAMGLARPAPKETTAQAYSSSSHQDDTTTSTSDSQHLIPPTHLLNLTTLLTSPYRSIILHHLSRAAKAAEQRIRSLMLQTRVDGQGSGQQTAGCTWDVQVGFHAVPSMDTVHCHVLSGELVSERLKNKKHYLSFSPTAGFFLPLSSFLPNTPDRLPHPASHYEALLKGPLLSHVDGKTYPNIPALKRHLNEAWLRGLVEGRKRVGDGEGGSSGGAGAGVAAPTVAEQGEHSETEDEEEGQDDKRPEKRLKVDDDEVKTEAGGSKGEVVSDGSHTESETEDEAV